MSQLNREQLNELFVLAHEGKSEELQKKLADFDEDFDKDGFACILSGAAQFGHVSCLEMLLPYSDVAHDESLSLQLAAEEGHAQCVERLIPLSDPNTRACHPLRYALAYGHLDCAKVLYPHTDIKTALAVMQNEYPSEADKWRKVFEDIKQELEADAQYQVLQSAVDQCQTPQAIRRV